MWTSEACPLMKSHSERRTNCPTAALCMPFTPGFQNRHWVDTATSTQATSKYTHSSKAPSKFDSRNKALLAPSSNLSATMTGGMYTAWWQTGRQARPVKQPTPRLRARKDQAIQPRLNCVCARHPIERPKLYLTLTLFAFGCSPSLVLSSWSDLSFSLSFSLFG